MELLLTEQLGPHCTPPRPHLDEVLSAATSATPPTAPLILVASGREDIAPVLEQLAAENAVQLVGVALGHGQETYVAAALQRAALAGDWLLFKVLVRLTPHAVVPGPAEMHIPRCLCTCSSCHACAYLGLLTSSTSLCVMTACIVDVFSAPAAGLPRHARVGATTGAADRVPQGGGLPHRLPVVFACA